MGCFPWFAVVNYGQQVDLTARFSCVFGCVFVDIGIATSQKVGPRKWCLEFGAVFSFT